MISLLGSIDYLLKRSTVKQSPLCLLEEHGQVVHPAQTGQKFGPVCEREVGDPLGGTIGGGARRLPGALPELERPAVKPAITVIPRQIRLERRQPRGVGITCREIFQGGQMGLNAVRGHIRQHGQEDNAFRRLRWGWPHPKELLVENGCPADLDGQINIRVIGAQRKAQAFAEREGDQKSADLPERRPEGELQHPALEGFCSGVCFHRVVKRRDDRF